ncbi:MAG TPA: NADP-dependent oxidoreductase [Rhizomicrobium sp.]|jgi:NADPH-dependent curcumin reductase CurA|nr:NADP-dependent oxidoreductase [Rhizomicrobium sp.]
MQNLKSREIRLKSRPTGMPGPANFELAETDVPNPGDGEVLIRNSYMSVDPYMRGRMMDRKSYVPPFQIGEALSGGAVGQVVASHSPYLKVGDFVQSMNGWREWFVAPAGSVMKIDASIAPVQAYLGALGMPGLTAYAGLLKIGELKEGERVFVSAASGAVGQIVCQIAKNKGCRVAGSAGSDDKCRFLTEELGIDAAINYRTAGDLTPAIKDAMPDGIDVYFENVGGAHLQAALNNMRQFGRIAACGMIDQYNATEPPPGPNNLILIVGLSLTVRGFIVSNHFDMMPEFIADMAKWTKEGKMKWRETIVEGIDKAPDAFIGLFKGENFGKMLVKVGPDKAV